MDTGELHDIELQLFIEAMRLRHGYDFGHYARASLGRRVRGLASAMGCAMIADLLPRLVHGPVALSDVLAHLSVPVTEMFRDPDVFKTLRTEVVPLLHSYPKVNIWQAGCATGEETYSLAILLEEEGLLDKTLIYATDFNDAALQTAEEGVYPARMFRDYTQNYLKAGGRGSLSDYYHARYDFGRMSDHLRHHIAFAHHSLATDGVFCEVQLIVCRNVLIYFDKTLQSRVLRLFADSLVRNGFLCLGTKESVRFTDAEVWFRPAIDRARIYQKRATTGEA